MTLLPLWQLPLQKPAQEGSRGTKSQPCSGPPRCWPGSRRHFPAGGAGSPDSSAALSTAPPQVVSLRVCALGYYRGFGVRTGDRRILLGPGSALGWERVRLSRRQRQRQARQAQQQPSSQSPQQQPPPAPQQLHPQLSRPPLSQTPLRHFPLPPRPQPPRPPSSPVPPAPPDVQLFPHVPQDPHVAATPFYVEQRVMHVGTCLTLLSYVLDQLHVCLARQGVEVGGMLPSEQSAAVSAAREMLHYLPLIGLVQGAPGAALGPGPGAMLRLAESAQGAPLGLVSAAASVLRWMDGRLCWILSE
ncbi:unnamed protein product [Closterium sp. NIES-65]|nr:unnamed protein product [Closterium sp. NIES-65]